MVKLVNIETFKIKLDLPADPTHILPFLHQRIRKSKIVKLELNKMLLLTKITAKPKFKNAEEIKKILPYATLPHETQSATLVHIESDFATKDKIVYLCDVVSESSNETALADDMAHAAEMLRHFVPINCMLFEQMSNQRMTGKEIIDRTKAYIESDISSGEWTTRDHLVLQRKLLEAFCCDNTKLHHVKLAVLEFAERAARLDPMERCCGYSTIESYLNSVSCEFDKVVDVARQQIFSEDKRAMLYCLQAFFRVSGADGRVSA
jgi:hypothetical protein